MKTVNLRSIRGAGLQKAAQAGELVGLLKNRRLIAVMIPVSPNWVAHVIEHNWSRVLQSVTEGELAMAGNAPMVTLDDALAQGGKAESPLPAQTMPFLASIGAVPSEDCDLPQTRTVRVGDLSGKLIEEAGDSDELLAVTNDGLLLGIVVPITQRLTQYMIGKNMSRVLFNIGYGEKEAAGSEPLAVIAQVLAEQSGLSRSSDAVRTRGD
jgi:hypothetical protein